MQTLKSVFGFLWALWSGVWFMLIVTVFTPMIALVLLVSGQKYVRACIWFCCRYLCTAHTFISLVFRRVHGKEHIDTKRTYVFVANHRALYDTLIAGSTVPHAASFLAKGELLKVPFFGYLIKKLAMPVDRKSKESRERSVRHLVASLQKGLSIFVFPEGTRNRTTDPLIAFRDGAFAMAIRAQVPILVQTIVGMAAVNAPQGVRLLPGVIDVYWSKPIETTGLTLADLESLKQRVRDEMLAHLV